ncbi:hypothetical protein PVK06_028739 [Gossypium arboreum]|uniref:Uncharacterized protein n=1 Tax=Gossypium arboreum TaxID=29729 RepID=A0ABR0P4R2_GOSAR|nr:hypothetical protein PVK06_028739 [Gossypium arboreum]
MDRTTRSSGFIFCQQIVDAIGGLIGQVVKLDFQTDNRTRGRFVCLAIFINLDKPLASQVMDLCPTVALDRVPTRLPEKTSVLSDCTDGEAVEERRSEASIRGAEVFNNKAGGFKLRSVESIFYDDPALKANPGSGSLSEAVTVAIEMEKLGHSDGSVHQENFRKDMVLDEANRRGFSNEIRGVSNERIFNNIIAHFNLAFEGSKGTPITISEGVLDPGKHSAIRFKERLGGKDLIERSGRKASNVLRSRGSRFKASGNPRVSLAESIEEMAKLISHSTLSKDLVSGTESVALSTNGDTVIRQ